MNWILEPFEYDFMRRALLACVLAASPSWQTPSPTPSCPASLWPQS
jgi:hypothetical protein